MTVRETSLPGVFLVEPKVFHDGRGFFVETFSTRDHYGEHVPSVFVQDNHSRSTKGVLRGLHYQLRAPQGKLVHVARGSIYDVAVDIRVGSPHFGEWLGIELNDENLRSLWIPPGFAHGFCVLSEVADVIYKCTRLFDAADDYGIAWNDPGIGVRWPEPEPVISPKDSARRRLSESLDYLPRFS